MTGVFEAIKKENLVITIPEHGQRLAVELFPYKGGAVFFDVGWTEGFGHPMHIIPGPIAGAYPRWQFGNPEDEGALFYAEIFDRGNHPALIMNNDTWAVYQAHEDGKHATTELAYEVFRRDFPESE
jgi:hypothetical protein